MNKFTGIHFYSRFGLALRFIVIVAMEFTMLALLAI